MPLNLNGRTLQIAKPQLVTENVLSKLKDDCGAAMYIGEADSLYIDYVACIAASPHLHPGQPPLWGYIAGPPSAGKTMLMEAFLGWSDHVTSVADLTKNALLSAHDTDGRRKKIRERAIAAGKSPDEADRFADPSLLPMLDKKMLMLPDATALVNNEDFKNSVMGMLRQAYDGVVTKHSGTIGGQTAQARFSLLIGVTDAGLDDAQMRMQQAGERMVVMRIEQHNPNCQEERESGLMALASRTEHGFESIRALKDACRRRMSTGVEQVRLGPLPVDRQDVEYKHYLIALASAVTKIRSQPGHGFANPTERNKRLVKIFAGFADVRARLCGRDRWSRDDMRLLRRLAADTIPSRLQLMLDYLYARHESPMGASARDVARSTGVPVFATEAQLNQWVSAGIAEHPSDGRFRLADDQVSHFTRLGLLPEC